MPMWMPSDTRDALGEFANRCENRSLLQERFVFLEGNLNEARRLALDLWVDNANGGASDIKQIAETAQTQLGKLQNKLKRPELSPKAVQRLRQDLAKQQTLQDLCKRLLENRSPWQTYPPRRAWLSALSQNSRSFQLSTCQRVAVGLANGVVENAGLTLHRRFGYPLIPGSALKGLAADGAADLEADAVLRQIVLGDDEDRTEGSKGNAGAVSFLDAVGEAARLELDILTPHFTRYYGGLGNPEAFDTEQPVPNVFPVVAIGARFRFDLVVVPGRSCESFQAKTLLDAGQHWLTHALETFGVGGKTRAGYGRFGAKNPKLTKTDLFPDLSTT